jgi:DNA invertase Pin-like site-specific DNA recombinase
VVVVTKLDRLGRSTRELLDLIDRMGKAGASFRSLGDPLWDTSSAQGRCNNAWPWCAEEV